MNPSLPVVRVSRKGALRAGSGHPWIFASDVVDRGAASPGAMVRVVDPRGETLGSAHYSSDSLITLRMLWEPGDPASPSFLEERVQRAIEYRSRVVRHSNAYRLIFSEADRLPGLIVDHYAGALTVQVLTQGMDRIQEDVLDVLERLLHPTGIALRNDGQARRKEGLPLEKRVARGEILARTPVVVNGLQLGVDLLGGQKTGIYLDQRENYRAAANSFRGGSVLDCFSSTGGFALHLARVATRVEAVDSSQGALETAAENARLNSIENIDFRQADVFDLLTGYSAAGRRFDAIILDPPAFAKTRGGVEGALRGYRDINLRALKLLAPGGLLVTCSCSHHVGEADFLGVIAEAALDAKRPIRVLERRTQAQDHPILLTVPETMYLKCLILETLN